VQKVLTSARKSVYIRFHSEVARYEQIEKLNQLSNFKFRVFRSKLEPIKQEECR